METLLSNHPSTYLQLIKQSIKVYRLAFFKVVPLSLLFSFVAFIPRLIADITGRNGLINLSLLNPNRLWILLINLFLLIILIGILWHIHCVIYKIREPLFEDVKVGLKKVFQVIIAAVIIFIIVIALNIIVYGIQVLLHRYHLLFTENLFGILFTSLIFLFQLLLLFYFSILFYFVVPLITVENQSILSAIDRSISLVWNHWWRVVSVQFTPWLCYGILLFIMRSVGFGVHIFFTAERAHLLWVTLMLIIIFALFIPWIAATMLVQLHDLELRNKMVIKSK